MAKEGVSLRARVQELERQLAESVPKKDAEALKDKTVNREDSYGLARQGSRWYSCGESSILCFDEARRKLVTD